MLYDAVFGQHEDNTKIFLTSGQQSVSYAEFHHYVNQLANCLVANGLKPGDRVAVQAIKSNSVLALYVATIKAGGVYLPLNTSYTPHELEYFISNAQASLVIIDSAAEAEITPIAGSQNAAVFTLDADETGSLVEQARDQSTSFNAVPRAADDLAAILYTSGTTGRSKGAQLSHLNLLSNTEILKDFWHFSSEDVLLHMLPIYHSHGLFVACNLLSYVGGQMIFLPKFDIEKALHFLPAGNHNDGCADFLYPLII